MDDSSGDGSGSAKTTIVDTWLEPLADSVCGEDLEYDNEFLEMTQAAAGKPETTFGTMNTDILEATVPGYVRPNFCDYIRNSRFET